MGAKAVRWVAWVLARGKRHVLEKGRVKMKDVNVPECLSLEKEVHA